MKPCATCWWDPVRREKTGHPDSNWICQKCRKREANRLWISTPSRETSRENYEDTDVRATPESEAGAFETPHCILIMTLHCKGKTQRQIAKHLGTKDLSHINETIQFWKKNRGEFVREVKRVWRDFKGKA